MAGSKTRSDAALITSAKPGRTLDVETRTRRYLWTMALRTACFLGFLILPGWWKLISLLAAGVLALIAVALANNADHRDPTTTAEAEDDSRRALPAGPVIEGVVEEDE